MRTNELRSIQLVRQPGMTGVMATALALSWATMLGHNLYELPISPLAPESTGPLVVAGVLLVVYWIRPRSRVALWAILGWALANLVVGGVITVLPLPILPFTPDQSLDHYLAHVYYAAGQVPLLVYSLAGLRRRPEPLT